MSETSQTVPLVRLDKKNNKEPDLDIDAMAEICFTESNLQSKINDVLVKFSSPLKTNFENRNLWLRFGLTLSLSHECPRSALQAFNECMRLDQFDPLPAMLAAKLVLEDLDDPEASLKLAENAIQRCLKLVETNQDSSVTTESKNSQTDSHYLEAKCCYKNVYPILSKCYLLASVINAYIYEREPESIRQFKIPNLKASLQYLESANKTYPHDYLIHFHKALHEARKGAYMNAIEDVKQAIKLNPQHVPSMQLLILSLSALKLFNEALILCESILHEFKDNILLLYIKCNLEQCLVETKGYKAALNTAQHLLKCIRSKSFNTPSDVRETTPTITASATTASLTQTADQVVETKQSTHLFAEGKSNDKDLFTSELFVWLLVAEIFIKMGSISDAELCVDEGSTHVNGALSHQIMFVRGLIAKAKNNLLEAKNFFQSCLALCPRHSSALREIAHVHYLLGCHSTAERFLRESLDIDSDCHKSWHYLSLVYIETNQHDKANECAKKATKLEEFSPVIPLLSIIPRLNLE